MPGAYIEYPEKHDPFMREMVSSGLVKQVIPDEYVWKANGFERAFLEYLEKDPETSRSIERFRAATHGTRIHMGKMANVGKMLCEMGLATASGYWYSVEPLIAEKFMTYLALLLGSLTDFQPATDRVLGLKHVALDLDRRETRWSEVRDAERALLLKEILPVPSRVPDPDRLIRFKQQHGDLLSGLRRRVEGFLLTLEKSPQYQREELKDLFREEIAAHRAEVERVLESKHWSPLSRSTLLSVGSAAFSLYSSHSIAAWAAGGLSILNVVASALDQTSIQNILLDRPIAYAVLAERRFRSSRRTAVKKEKVVPGEPNIERFTDL